MGERSASTEFAIRCATDIIRNSKKGAVLTGAGISTPSGIPDFRSPKTGLWEQYDPELASQLAFRYDPEQFLTWMRPLASKICCANPNLAHLGLARLEEAGFIQTVITQNVDGLHQRAGSKNVLEVHGTLQTLSCIRCYRQVPSQGYIELFVEQGEIPRCGVCGGVLKPDMVLFGEQLPSNTWLRAMRASRDCDMMIVAGSSLEVLPVASLPMRAIERGAHLIIINHSQTYLDVRADVVFHEDVIDIIPWIVQEVLGE